MPPTLLELWIANRVANCDSFVADVLRKHGDRRYPTTCGVLRWLTASRALTETSVPSDISSCELVDIDVFRGNFVLKKRW